MRETELIKLLGSLEDSLLPGKKADLSGMGK
jgi:hypothetical protein